MPPWDWSDWSAPHPHQVQHAHSGPISAVATGRLNDGSTLIITGGDCSLILRSLRPNGQVAYESLAAHLKDTR
jgi:hypothetical protein